jgi:hypothetical protein
LEVSLLAAGTLEPLLKPLARAAASRLDLASYLPCKLQVCLDDFLDDERVWFQEETWFLAGKPLRVLSIYVHPDQFLKDRSATLSLLPSTEIWESQGKRIPTVAGVVQDFSRTKAERCFYHHFLFVRDIYDGSMQPDSLAQPWLEAFQEAWAVTVDGRLRRWRLPGYSVAERRRRFSRVFSAAGVLLPEHWRIFHQLWEMEVVGHDEVFQVIRRLPELSRRRQ